MLRDGAKPQLLVAAIACLALTAALASQGVASALDTLKRRFAKGELTAEEYQERKRLLEGS